MRSMFMNSAGCVLTGTLLLAVAGCYEERGPTPVQTQQTQPTVQEQGPITSYGSQGGGSALGGAKRAATNIADKAQQESQRVADQADELFNDE